MKIDPRYLEDGWRYEHGYYSKNKGGAMCHNGRRYNDGYMTIVRYYEGNKECKYIYSGYTTLEIEHKYIGGRFLTTLILSLIACLANIGLALFGFFMAKSGEF